MCEVKTKISTKNMSIERQNSYLSTDCFMAMTVALTQSNLILDRWASIFKNVNKHKVKSAMQRVDIEWFIK